MTAIELVQQTMKALEDSQGERIQTECEEFHGDVGSMVAVKKDILDELADLIADL